MGARGAARAPSGSGATATETHRVLERPPAPRAAPPRGERTEVRLRPRLARKRPVRRPVLGAQGPKLGVEAAGIPGCGALRTSHPRECTVAWVPLWRRGRGRGSSSRAQRSFPTDSFCSPPRAQPAPTRPAAQRPASASLHAATASVCPRDCGGRPVTVGKGRGALADA